MTAIRPHRRSIGPGRRAESAERQNKRPRHGPGPETRLSKLPTTRPMLPRCRSWPHPIPPPTQQTDRRPPRPPLTKSTPGGRIYSMIFSTRAEYGVRLMVELGRQGGEGPTPLNAIADAERLPLSYLERIVARL